MRRLVALIMVLLAGAAVSTIMWVVGSDVGRDKTASLLAGNVGPELESIVVEYQQRRLDITDPKVLRFFEERFRRSDTHQPTTGTTYRMALRYRGGGSASFSTYWGDGGFSVAFDQPDRMPSHRIVLADNPSPEVVEILRFIDLPWQDAKGRIMHVEPGRVRYTLDRSLIAE